MSRTGSCTQNIFDEQNETKVLYVTIDENSYF